MNKELIKIRDNLNCNYCSCKFKGSDSQAWKVKYEKRNVYCSKECRVSFFKELMSLEIPEVGPCQNCGEMFRSKTNKYYCSIECYSKSDYSKKRLSDLSKELAKKRELGAYKRTSKGTYINCINCEKEIYSKPSQKRKYCSLSCYRIFMNSRFDRYIASNYSFVEVKGYDEFLSKEVLPCVVEGCDWEGHNLSCHMNYTHGIKKYEFKELAGFNRTTGVISMTLLKKLESKDITGVALTDNDRKHKCEKKEQTKKNRYKLRPEGIEHFKKAVILRNNKDVLNNANKT